MLHGILNKSWKQHPTKLQLYDHLPHILQTIQERPGKNCRKINEFISNFLLWTPTHGHTNVGRPAKSYIRQFFADIECHLGDLPRVLTNKVRC